MAFGDAAVAYAEEVLTRRYSPANRIDQLRYLGWLEEHLGKETLLSAIDTVAVDRLVKVRRLEPVRLGRTRKLQDRLVKDSTVNRTVAEPLRRLFNWARDLKGATIGRVHWSSVVTKEKVEHPREVHSHEEPMLDRLPVDYRRVVRFAQLTGLRQRECLLRWDQIIDGCLHIIGKGDKKIIKVISPPMQAILDEARAAQAAAPTTHVFTFTRDGLTKPITQGSLKSLWQRARKTGVVPSDLRFHDLRHDYATKLLRATKNLKLVQRSMGHSNIKTTLRYAHVNDDEVATAEAELHEKIAAARAERQRAGLRVVG